MKSLSQSWKRKRKQYSMNFNYRKKRSTAQDLLTKYTYELPEERQIDAVLREGIRLANYGKWEDAAGISLGNSPGYSRQAW
jgi:hypothetical protein